MKVSSTLIIRGLVAVAVIAAVVVVWRVAGIHDQFWAFIAWLEAITRKSGPGGAVAFFSLATLGAAIGPFSAAPVVPVAVRIWGGILTGVMLLVGGILGGSLTYLIGRFAGERVLKLFVRPTKLERLKTRVQKDTAFWMAVIIKFAMPAEIGYVFGSIQFGLLRYVMVSFFANVPIVIAMVLAGRAFVEGRIVSFILPVAGLAALTGLAAWHLWKLEQKKKPAS